MKNLKKILTTGLCVLMVGVLLPVVSLAEETDSKKVLATVGKVKITQEDLDAKISMLPPQFRARYETPEGKTRLLDQTIKFSLLSQEARAKGIQNQEEVAKKIKEITDNIIIQALTKEKVSDAVTVSDQDIEKHYKENKDSFTTPEKVKVNLILFEVAEGATPDQKKAKKQQADSALKRLKKGEDFETLAKELSEDRRTKKRGGSTGFFARGKRKNTYGDVFEKKAFALKAGDVSGVFEDKRGYYIIKLAEKKEMQEQTLDEVKQRIERKLKQSKQKEAYESFVESLKKKYPVKVMN